MGGLPRQPWRMSFDLDRRIEETFEELIHTPWGRELVDSTWQPPTDVYESEDAYLIEVDLPGVAPERVDVRAAGSRVTIHGTRDTLTSGLSPTDRSLLLERRHGQFSRTIELGCSIDTDRIEMQFERGTLRIRVPKRTTRIP